MAKRNPEEQLSKTNISAVGGYKPSAVFYPFTIVPRIGK